MLTRHFGLIGAVGGIGILDDPGLSWEGGICIVLGGVSFFAGYSDHNMGTESKYTKGAFDKTERRGDPLGGGMFMTLVAEF